MVSTAVVQALQLLRHVVGDEIRDDDARLVQHDVAERDAVVERRAGEMQRAAGGGLGAGLGERRQFARGDHLGEHHRGGLQRLLFLLGIGAPRPVLHHQHAERVAGAQDRHAEEGMVNLFAGLRPVREGRMGLGLRQVDRVGLARDQADQALVRAQHGLVHRLPVQAFGGVQLERAVHAQHVDGADLRHHVGGDQHHDLVQALLRADRLRHHLAKPAQQHARTAERATHDVILGPPITAGAASPAARRKSGNGTRRARRPQRLQSIKPIANARGPGKPKDSRAIRHRKLPGIARRNAAAGGAEFVAVDERGVDMRGPSRRGAVSGSRRHAAIWPEQPLDGLCDVVSAGGPFELAERQIRPVSSSRRGRRLEERQARHGAAGQEARQPMIGMRRRRASAGLTLRN